jgi:FkbM family methyltransferase
VARGGFNWELDLREGIDFAIYLFGAFEWSTVRACNRLVRPGDTVLDIGANIGAHTLNLARLVGPSGHVIAFEPTLYAFEKQQRNISLNPDLAERITSKQIMLTESDEGEPEPAIYSAWPLVGGEKLHELHMGRAEATTGARAQRLDSVLEELDIEQVDFIKLDVDGFECDVLGGASKTLGRSRPIILMEFAPYLQDERGRSFAELINTLVGYNYRFFALSGRRELKGDAEGLSKSIKAGASMNVVARAV